MYLCSGKVLITTIMEDIYMMSDAVIAAKIGERLKALRLKQNITQMSLAGESEVSLSVIKNIEKGEIRSFDAFLRLLRTLGQLEVLLPLVEEQQLTPSEYYELRQKADVHQRRRATGRINRIGKEDIGW